MSRGIERFSLEVAFTADEHQKEGFRFLLSLHSGSDQDQVLVGQWGPYIIVMKGDDFEHTRRDPRISVKLGSQMDTPTLLAITTDANGTSIYVDGRRVESEPRTEALHSPGARSMVDLGKLGLRRAFLVRSDCWGWLFTTKPFPQNRLACIFRTGKRTAAWPAPKSTIPCTCICLMRGRGK